MGRHGGLALTMVERSSLQLGWRRAAGVVALGNDDRFSEVSPGGNVVREARLPMKGARFFGFYRASRIASLDAVK